MREFFDFNFLTALGSLLAAAICSWLLVFPIRAMAGKLGAVDIPTDKRRMHKIPVPLLGGLAIFVSFALFALLFCRVKGFLGALLIGGLLVTLTGFVDDLYDLNPFLKLLAETAAALIVVAEGTSITGIWLLGSHLEFSRAVSLLLTLLWIVGITNATNLMDGLDGLSSGVCVIASVTLAVISLLEGKDPVYTLLLLLLAGATLGFIPHNFAKKKTFMGDTGALLLGYLLSCLSIQGVFKTHAVLSFVIPVVIFSLPIFDTGFAFFRRLFTDHHPFRADRKHLHHRLVDMGFTRMETVLILWGISAFMSLLALSLYLWKADPFICFLVVLVLLLGLYILVCYKSEKSMQEKPLARSAEIARLKKKKLYLLDMDGTLYIGNKLFKATTMFLSYIKRTGGKYYFLTNNSSKCAADYVAKLQSLGIEAEEDEFITSVQATIEYLRTEHPGESVFLVGTDSFRRELREAGIDLRGKPDPDVSVLVVGYDTELNYEKLRAACLLLRREEVAYLATNPDWVCPSEEGDLPDCGSICQLLEKATGRKPVVIGKPAVYMVEMALRRSGLTKDDALIIGDRLYTDIACGEAAGIDSAFVLSGEGTIADIQGSDVKPTYTFDGIGELIRTVVQ